MPHNNRVNGSIALNTNDMWSKTIGHDPYASTTLPSTSQQQMLAEQNENLLMLAKISKLSGTEARGGCSKCGQLGHLSFQCRNQAKAVEPVVETSSSSGDDSDIDSDEDLYHRAVGGTATNETSLRHVKRSRDDVEVDERRKKLKESSSSSSSKKHKKKEKKHKHKHKKSKSRHKDDKD